MDNPKYGNYNDRQLRFTAVAYYAVMLAAFVVGLYGFFSLFWLATAQTLRGPILPGV